MCRHNIFLDARFANPFIQSVDAFSYCITNWILKRTFPKRPREAYDLPDPLNIVKIDHGGKKEGLKFCQVCTYIPNRGLLCKSTVDLMSYITGEFQLRVLTNIFKLDKFAFNIIKHLASINF